MIRYFKNLLSEILKLLPHKKKKMLVKDAYAEFRYMSKNDLIRVLTNVVADKNKTLPVLKNKEEVKTWSKRYIIKNIIFQMQS